MVNRNLIRSLDVSEEEWQQELTEGEITEIPDPHNVSVAMLLKGRTISGAFGAGGQALALRDMELLKARLPATD